MNQFLLFLLVGISSAFLGLKYISQVEIPAHLLNHEVLVIPDLLTEEDAAHLMKLSKEEEIPTNVADLKFYKTKNEHIGEALPLENGKCSHPFLVPSINRTLCVLPGRVDVARHFLKTGGVQGMKENYDDAVSRLQSFGRYTFELTPFMQKLFDAPKFKDAALVVCPKDKTVLDAFQLNLITQVPGQTVAMHLDAPYFWGASRFQFPQWLLVVMVFSNLFQDIFVDQVQVVGYYHTWNATDGVKRDGDFVIHRNSSIDYSEIKPVRLSGNAVDGSQSVHAASTYFHDRKPPKLDKSKKNVLKYIGGKNEDEWHVISGDQIIGKYTTDELRMTVVYRARCFRTEEEKVKFNSENVESLALKGVLDTLAKDLLKRERITESQYQLYMKDYETKEINSTFNPKLELAMKLMDEYIKYPFPKSAIPFNYCAVDTMYPSLKPYLAYLGC